MTTVQKSFKPVTRHTHIVPKKHKQVAIKLLDVLHVNDVGFLFGVHPYSVHQWKRNEAR